MCHSFVNRDQPSMTASAVEHPILLVVAGVSGSGKSAFGSELAKRLNIPFIDGDDLHPTSNIEKMKSGMPLDDLDREPWLNAIRIEALKIVKHPSLSSDQARSQSPAIVIACSALKRKYRDILRGSSSSGSETVGLSRTASPDVQVHFIYLQGDPELIKQRLEKRKNHFMGSNLLGSQLDTLEEPDPQQENSDHSKIITIPLLSPAGCQPKSLEEMVDEALQELSKTTRFPMAPAQLTHQSSVELPSLDGLFNTEPDQLRDVLALLFEVSDSIENKLIPILREQTKENSLDSYSGLIDRCEEIVGNHFGIDEQVNFLGSHPRIGEVRGLSKLSSNEQGNQSDQGVLDRLKELNMLYEELYPGLRYVTYVNGRSRAEIVKEMEALLIEDKSTSPKIHFQDQEWHNELKRGISDVFRIAKSRSKSMIGVSSS
ncbi:hypothetical protein Pst134EA_001163 [Puccinia striiformis f. sp. tritici]|nr:hypothetical protein Pst134EA_001163 [Puccinia striiformis f. sp. tritici]KAH9474120.1 hypothetical protein Pst134EA_001163 [Puccinia striiformis f. sp. tritici]KAI9626048.1 hypothetical protein H4Q26_016037 [Puccinia striiformis f. sp. tritici PST-130]